MDRPPIAIRVVSTIPILVLVQSEHDRNSSMSLSTSNKYCSSAGLQRCGLALAQPRVVVRWCWCRVGNGKQSSKTKISVVNTSLFMFLVGGGAEKKKKCSVAVGVGVGLLRNQ